MPSISKKGNKIPPSPIRKLVPYADDAKKRGIEILHLNIGQPDIKSPVESLNAVKETDLDLLKYEYSQGSLEFRNNVCNYYKKHSIYVSPDDIITTVGASEALSFTMNSICDPGDEVIIPEPFYANYNGFALASDVNVIPITSKIEDNFALPSIHEFEKKINSKIRGIISREFLTPLEETRLAIEEVVISKEIGIALFPRPSLIRKQQHELIHHYQLIGITVGKGKNKIIRILPSKYNELDSEKTAYP